MWWYGRGISGGSWLPEEIKANMWHGRGNSRGPWSPAFPSSTYKLVFFIFIQQKQSQGIIVVLKNFF